LVSNQDKSFLPENFLLSIPPAKGYISSSLKHSPFSITIAISRRPISPAIGALKT
jgi:hypothetical protein